MIKKVINALLDQIWTLLGMFVAWVVLEGSAKTVVMYAIAIVTLIYVTWKSIQEEDK